MRPWFPYSTFHCLGSTFHASLSAHHILSHPASSSHHPLPSPAVLLHILFPHRPFSTSHVQFPLHTLLPSVIPYPLYPIPVPGSPCSPLHFPVHSLFALHIVLALTLIHMLCPPRSPLCPPFSSLHTPVMYSRRHAANPNPHASCSIQLLSRPSYMSLIRTPHFIRHTFFPVTLVQSAMFFPSFPFPSLTTCPHILYFISIPNLQSPCSPIHLPLCSLHTVSVLRVSSHTRKHHTSCSILSAHPSTPQPLTCYLIL